MPTPTLFETAFDNRGLFSDHYLEERFSEREDVQALQEEADQALGRVRELYRSIAAEADTWNEAQTEDNFVQPVLSDVLGWARVVQENIQRQGRRGRPDYALYTDQEQRDTAVERARNTETTIFDYADAVADAKYWDRPLDGPAPDPEREKRSEMRRNNPSFQIIDYVTLTGVNWGILTNGTRWRLYYEGAPSRLETYFEVNLPEIVRLADGNKEDQQAAREAFRLFYALFRADAHRPIPITDGEKFVDVVYDASDTYAETLEDTLKGRVFDHVFLELATGLYEDHMRRDGADDSEVVLDDVYRATLRLLYRLLFLFYAESRGLLPLDNPGYYEHSLTHLAQRAKEEIASGRALSEKHPDFWNDLDGLFLTIDEGDAAFDVPAYNGGLFRRGSDANAFLDNHQIGQKYVVHALVNLTSVDPEDNPAGPSVDYTSLDVRQLGSIYEGLLEHRLVLTEDGDLDLRTDEGERKETGSYYTPHYVVEYIVEETLGPIVDDRIEQFEAAMDEIADIVDGRDPDDPGVRAKLDAPRQKAVDAFLTVRVCDPAMGSGHFLVYAADYLAERFGQVLGRYPNHNPVTQRLEEIRQSILDELARQGVDTDGLAGDERLRDTSLLKRLVMKRCIYGVDLNPMAVELAKLSLWLHSFTVGAPLSFLDHHLKTGNSLIGTSVGTVVEEIQADLFGNVRDEILRGTRFLQDAAFNTDATLADVEASAEAFETYQDTMRPYKRLLDLWTAQHFGHDMGRTLVRDYAREVIQAYKNGEGVVLEEYTDTVQGAERLSDEKRVFHWELEFPEVFYEFDPPGNRDNPGFDAVIGNPPYDVLIRSEQDVRFIDYVNSNFQTAQYNPNLYALFCEHSIDVSKRDGRIGQIIQNSWLTQDTFSNLRELVTEQTEIASIRDLRFSAFDEIVPTSILIAENKESNGKSTATVGIYTGEEDIPTADREVKHADLQEVADIGFEDYLTDQPPIAKGPDTIELEELYTVYRGVETRDNSKYLSESEETEEHEPILNASDVSAYLIKWSGEYVYFVPEELKSNADIEMYDVEEKVLLRRTGDRLIAGVDKDQMLALKNLYLLLPRTEHSADYLCASLNSTLLGWERKRITRDEGETFAQLKGTQVARLPIRKIDFKTDGDEREAHVSTLIDAFEATRAENTTPNESPVLDNVSDHLDANRADVVHDLLARLAREMTDLKAERATYHLDVTDYVSAPSDNSEVTLRDVGRYQPAPGVHGTLLAETTVERENLRVGRLETERDGDTIRVSATARFKPQGDRESWPDAVPEEAERDQWDYVETDPILVCTLHDCTKIEAGLVIHWLDALNDADSGFSGYRDNATKTNSLLNRIHDARFPDPSDEDIRDALRPFLRNAQEAAELDRQITFTDGLIDQIVYRLYGLTDEEIAVVEN